VQVFFTRNGKVVGKKEVHMPRGGFYPTVGMMSSQVNFLLVVFRAFRNVNYVR
jgi:hypothetical protein